jgi:hypothetical protein
MASRTAVVGIVAVAVVGLTATVAFGAGSATGARACGPGEVRALVVDFVVAFNGGDLARLDAIFAPSPAFKWYSSNAPGRRVRSAAFRRGTLLDYFARRHARRDRVRLLGFRFNGNSGGYGHFDYRMRRSAADFRGGQPFRLVGKGAVDCSLDPKAIAVWSMGGPRPG